jgi:hypothetical protein
MGDVLHWPRHKLHGPWCCDGLGSTGAPDGCTSCVLAHCMVCSGAEGSLPTHCPGRSMTPFEEENVYAGRLDFKDGQWIAKGPVYISGDFGDAS